MRDKARRGLNSEARIPSQILAPIDLYRLSLSFLICKKGTAMIMSLPGYGNFFFWGGGMGIFIYLQQHRHLCTCFVPCTVLTTLYPVPFEVGITTIHAQGNRGTESQYPRSHI